MFPYGSWRGGRVVVAVLVVVQLYIQYYVNKALPFSVPPPNGILMQVMAQEHFCDGFRKR